VVVACKLPLGVEGDEGTDLLAPSDLDVDTGEPTAVFSDVELLRRPPGLHDGTEPGADFRAP